jgi:hypothetical protein
MSNDLPPGVASNRNKLFEEWSSIALMAFDAEAAFGCWPRGETAIDEPSNRTAAMLNRGQPHFWSQEGVLHPQVGG